MSQQRNHADEGNTTGAEGDQDADASPGQSHAPVNKGSSCE